MSSLQTKTEEHLDKFILNMMLDYENSSTSDININVGKFMAIKNKICDELNIQYPNSSHSNQQQIESLLQKYKNENI